MLQSIGCFLFFCFVIGCSKQSKTNQNAGITSDGKINIIKDEEVQIHESFFRVAETIFYEQTQLVK